MFKPQPKNPRCYACASATTYTTPKGHSLWYLNKDSDNNVLCTRCFDVIVYRPKKYPTYEERRKAFSEWAKGRPSPKKGRRYIPERECYACGSNRTYMDKKTGKINWMINRDETGKEIHTLCHDCKMRHFVNPRRGPQHFIVYKGKQIKLKHDPKIGICSNCGKTGKTQMHHWKYDDSDPLAYTIEVCASCHAGQAMEITAHRIARELELFTQWRQSKAF